MKGEGGASSSSFSSNVDDNGNRELSVLAVDDNLVDRKLIEKLLKTSFFKVTIAENGMKALEYLGLGDDSTDATEELKVDLILTDYCMPEITGYDLLKKIKESSHMKEVPVVILSSENVPERINKCLEKGAEMFLLKPLQISDVQKLRDLVMRSTN